MKTPFSTLVSPFNQGPFNVLVRMPLYLFRNGEEGGWYDPSDLTTLFQGDGKTTPATATLDPLGAIEDKSGNGNDLLQTVSAARPPTPTMAHTSSLTLTGLTMLLM